MAKIGGQLGNQNASKGRPWTAALQRALKTRSLAKQRDALDDLAEKLLESCDNKEQWAFNELANRIEGKVKDNDDQGYKVIVIRQLDSNSLEPIDVIPHQTVQDTLQDTTRYTNLPSEYTTQQAGAQDDREAETDGTIQPIDGQTIR